MAEPREPFHLEDEEAEDEEDVGTPWPAEHMLASVWEENGAVRHRIRMTGKILEWPRKELTGIATLTSLSFNSQAIADAIKVWSTTSKAAKSPPLKWLKQEVGPNGFHICMSCRCASFTSC